MKIAGRNVSVFCVTRKLSKNFENRILENW